MKSKFEFNHDVATVLELLHDPQFLVDRLIELGDLDADCEVEEDNETVTVTINRLKADDVPGFLKKIAGSEQKINIVEQWRAEGEGYAAVSLLKILGTPIRIHSRISLNPNSREGCVYAIELEPEVKVPLIGGKIKQFVEKRAAQEILTEHQYTEQYLNN